MPLPERKEIFIHHGDTNWIWASAGHPRLLSYHLKRWNANDSQERVWSFYHWRKQTLFPWPFHRLLGVGRFYHVEVGWIHRSVFQSYPNFKFASTIRTMYKEWSLMCPIIQSECSDRTEVGSIAVFYPSLYHSNFTVHGHFVRQTGSEKRKRASFLLKSSHESQ